jgi:N-hydroxyarylamine O-acetyltransferase
LNSKIDLEAYFKRIRYEGPVTANLDTLCKLQRLHTQAIPFENLNPLFGIPVKLEKESLLQKLVLIRRGGYCFEHNILFRHVLEMLGFEVRPLAGRVMWNQPEGRIMPRTHMLLLIYIDGNKYLSDVGMSRQTPTAPLLLEPNIVQETPHEPFVISDKGDHYVLRTKIGEDWRPLYRFDLQYQFPIDYEVANWYVSTNPGFHFVHQLIAAFAAKECRYVLYNNKFSIHHINGKSKHQTLANADELQNVLEDVFCLKLPIVDNLQPTLERLCVSKDAV